MTVLDNVMVGGRTATATTSPADAQVVERALAALDFVGLRADAEPPVAALSYGHQRYVEIARALAASRPRRCCSTSPPPG